jgi:hypothetical protein
MARRPIGEFVALRVIELLSCLKNWTGAVESMRQQSVWINTIFKSGAKKYQQAYALAKYQVTRLSAF